MQKEYHNMTSWAFSLKMITVIFYLVLKSGTEKNITKTESAELPVVRILSNLMHAKCLQLCTF